MDIPPQVQPTPPVQPAGSNSNDKLWIILSHLSFLLGVGFLLPLIVWLVQRQENPTVAEHAKEVLNFHISLLLYGLLSIPLCFVCIGFVTIPVIILLGFIFSIVGAIKASEGGFFRYPLCIRLIN